MDNILTSLHNPSNIIMILTSHQDQVPFYTITAFAGTYKQSFSTCFTYKQALGQSVFRACIREVLSYLLLRQLLPHRVLSSVARYLGPVEL